MEFWISQMCNYYFNSSCDTFDSTGKVKIITGLRLGVSQGGGGARDGQIPPPPIFFLPKTSFL